MEVHCCGLPGRSAKQGKSESAGELERKGNGSSWRKSTLLRSGRRTKPVRRPEEAGLEDLDDAFQPAIEAEIRRPPSRKLENFKGTISQIDCASKMQSSLQHSSDDKKEQTRDGVGMEIEQNESEMIVDHYASCQ